MAYRTFQAGTNINNLKKGNITDAYLKQANDIAVKCFLNVSEEWELLTKNSRL